MKLTFKQIFFILLFCFGIVMFILAMIFQHAMSKPYVIALFVTAFVLIESRLLFSFFHELIFHKSLGEELLVLVASAITLALADYIESLSLVVMYMIGEIIMSVAEKKSDSSCCCRHELHEREHKGVFAFINYYAVAVLSGIIVVIALSFFMNLLSYSDILKTFAILLLIGCPCTLFINAPLCKLYMVDCFRKSNIPLYHLSDLDQLSKCKSKQQAQEKLPQYQSFPYSYLLSKSYRFKIIVNLCITIAAKIAFMILALFYSNTLFAVGADIAIALVIWLNAAMLPIQNKKRIAVSKIEIGKQNNKENNETAS